MPPQVLLAAVTRDHDDGPEQLAGDVAGEASGVDFHEQAPRDSRLPGSTEARIPDPGAARSRDVSAA